MSIDYQWLYDTVRKRFASDAAMEAYLPQAKNAQELAALGDDRYLSAMSQRVFQAGMTHSVVNNKWPNFEEAFWGFVPEKMVLLSPEQIDAYMKNDKIIRHRTKLQSIPQNAQFILDIRQEQGTSFAQFIADWPAADIVGLWQFLAKRACRLGGRSGAGFLRLIGKDTFFTTTDVIARLNASGIVDREPKTQRELQLVQNAFNDLHQQSSRPLCQLSAMLSLSINPRF